MLTPPFKITKRFDGSITTEHQNGSTLDSSNGINICLSFESRDSKCNQYVTWEMWSDDETLYGEGGIHIDCNSVVYDYDGCFTLAKEIVYILKELNYNTDELDNSL